MAHHHHGHDVRDDRLQLGGGARVVLVVGLVVGVAGLLLTWVLPRMMAWGADPREPIRRSFFAYLVAFAFFLTLAIGGLFFVLVHYVTRAGWSTAVRRIPEALAKCLPLMLVLSLPLVYSVYMNHGDLYRWAQVEQGMEGKGNEMRGEARQATGGAEPVTGTERAGRMQAGEKGGRTGEPAGEPKSGESMGGLKKYPIEGVSPVDGAGHPLKPDELVEGKLTTPVLLKPESVMIRDIVGMVVLSLIAWWYTSRSRKQDVTADPEITRGLNVRSAPNLVLFGLCVTMLAYDFLMSLDPVWFSTMFGPYFFAGCAVSMYATTILICQLLQRMGYLQHSIRRDHYHDLSKWQFTFTFFWGYVGFSQFMLQWYSSQPEELTWFSRRGASTAEIHMSGWTWMMLILLFSHLLIPFAGLLSRHVKRAAVPRMFWAGWILAAHFVDLFIIVMPEYDGRLFLDPALIAAVLGVGGLFVAAFTWSLGKVPLLPVNDPRLPESLGFPPGILRKKLRVASC